MRLAVCAVFALVLVPTASAAPTGCGSSAYSYAGVSSVEPAAGVAASITLLQAPALAAGHVAAWVGVGGEGLGPGGTSEWLQAGISVTASHGPTLYYELALPNTAARYVPLRTVPVGTPFEVAVVESARRAEDWRVWVDGRPATRPFALPGSRDAWAPVATAESWNGDEAGLCNPLAFRLAHVHVAAAPGGDWRPISGRMLADAGYRVERTANSSLVAVGG